MTTTIDIKSRKEAIEEYLRTKALQGFPQNLQDSTYHIMTLNGKRLRPILVLTVASGYNISEEKAMSAAVAIEVFHNFTLVHDDIMDQAVLRRGTISVHEKFGVDKAILTGGAMFPHAISLLRRGNEGKTNELMAAFIKMGKEVMEGQQYDMEFESREDVSLDEYIHMIGLKTSVLFGCACEIGGIIGNASEEDRKNLYNFGFYTGLAFQIMDDYLDTFGDETFGKRIGGDILLNKKTFLLISALEAANSEQRERIFKLFDEKNEEAKIEQFKELYKELNVPKLALDKMEDLYLKSQEAIKNTSLSEDKKDEILALGEIMLRRRK